jgi:hypothetical protein
MAPPDLAQLWRDCGAPRGAQRLARALLEPPVYDHVRGVAQQAARLAIAASLDDEPRRLLLRAAWLHDIGLSVPGAFPPTAGARMLRRGGLEGLARMVAHQVGAAYEVILRGLPALTPEFPAPHGAAREVAQLLDIAILTTGQDGAASERASARGASWRRSPARRPARRECDRLGLRQRAAA